MRDRRFLALCLTAFGGAGFLLRATLAIIWPTVQRPDEVFQNIEPAYRLWTGWGVVTWEWRDGIRSWLLPDFLYGVLRTTGLLGLPASWGVPAISVALAAVSVAVVLVAIVLGWRRSGRSGAVLCGLLCAFWPDLVYFGPKPLAEVQAGNLLVMAAGLASLGWPIERRLLTAIGALLGLALDVRFQLGPAIAVVAVGAARLDRRHWLWLALGVAGPLALLGIVDAVTWGSPFQSVWKNLFVNAVQGKADFYGVLPFYWYVGDFGWRYGLSGLLLAVCFALGVRQAPILALVTVVVVAEHSLIGHKETSFIYAAIPAGMITAGLGAAWAVERLPRPAPAIGAAVWLGAILLVAASEHPYRQHGPQAWMQTLWREARLRPDLCGLGLYRAEFPWAWTGGYSGLRRPEPIYLLLGPEAFAAARPAFNYVIAEAADDVEDEKLACAGPYCLFHHPLACTPMPEFGINEVLARSGN